MKIDPFIETIKQSVVIDSDRDVRITETSFFYNLFGHSNTKRFPKIHIARINFIIICAALLGSIIVLGSMLIFFFNGVLMPPSDNAINAEGGLRFKQSCGRECVLYLLSPAKPWSDTGIELCEGDKVTFSVSGTFHPNIGKMISAAEENNVPEFISYFNEHEESVENYEYRDSLVDPKHPIGTLLYCIYPHTRTRSAEADPIVSWTKDDPTFVAKKGGTLMLGINDRTPYNKRKEIYFKADSTPFFGNNIGEMLITISIERNIWQERDMSFMDKLFSSLYRIID